jgi:membrane-bound serine protease (ClpP class)
LKEAPERFLDAKQVDETGQNRFLTVSAARAQELRLVEHVVADDQALVALLGSPKIARTKLTGTDKAVYLLNRPWLTALLLIVGLIGIYLEAAAPGISVAGLTAVICFGIFFWSHALGGTAGILEILLFALGVGCIACELLLLPGFGIFGISGIGLIAASLVMATQTFVIPETNADWQALQMNSVVVLGAMLFVVVLGVGQILLFDSLPGLNLFRLQPPVDAPAEFDETPPQLTQVSPAVIPLEIGMSGAAESDLRPAGKVNINGHLIDVVTEGDYVEKGATVSVIRVEGNRITVRVES